MMPHCNKFCERKKKVMCSGVIIFWGKETFWLVWWGVGLCEGYIWTKDWTIEESVIKKVRLERWETWLWISASLSLWFRQVTCILHVSLGLITELCKHQCDSYAMMVVLTVWWHVVGTLYILFPFPVGNWTLNTVLSLNFGWKGLNFKPKITFS